MQLLAVQNVYQDDGDCFDAAFLKLLENPPTGFEVVEGNAGLGADWPAAIWKNANALAIALAVFSAPSTIKENWPIWKNFYDQAVTFMMEFHDEFRIDRDTAQMIAMHHAVEVLGMNPDTLIVHMAIRHYRHGSGSYQDLLLEERIDMVWPEGEHGSAAYSQCVRSNQEAARQAVSRYIFGVEDLKICKTIIIEMDGTVTLSAEL